MQGQGRRDMGCGGRQEVLPTQDSRCLRGLRDAGSGASPELLKEPPLFPALMGASKLPGPWERVGGSPGREEEGEAGTAAEPRPRHD